MTDNTKWIALALLGAVFAAVVQITSKAALNYKQFDPATLNWMRAIVMAVAFSLLLGTEFAAGTRDGSALTWANVTTSPMLKAGAIALLSGLAAAASWYFGYKALALADVSKTYPLDKLSVAIGVLLAVAIFRERPTGWNWSGILLMILGAYLVTLPKGKGLLWAFGGAK